MTAHKTSEARREYRRRWYERNRERELALAAVRKERYRGTCLTCGARTTGSNGPRKAPTECARCMQERQHEERYWTPERIVAAIRGFAEKTGRPPCATEWLHANTRNGSPPVAAVQREFGSWAAAVEEAGFPRPRVGVYERTEETLRRLSESLTVWTTEQILDAIRGWAAEHGEPPTITQWVRRSDSHPCSATVAKRFGRWNLAIEAAGFTPRRGPGRRTHCKRGHEFTAENTYVVESTGARVCRTCQRERARRYYYANKEPA